MGNEVDVRVRGAIKGTAGSLRAALALLIAFPGLTLRAPRPAHESDKETEARRMSKELTPDLKQTPRINDPTPTLESLGQVLNPRIATQINDPTTALQLSSSFTADH